jgi:hypothetical protein
MRQLRRTNRPYHSSGCPTPASHEIRPKDSMWDLWQTKWHCSRFIAEKFGSCPPTITPLMHHQDYCIGPASVRNTKGSERTILLQLANYTVNRALVIPLGPHINWNYNSSYSTQKQALRTAKATISIFILSVSTILRKRKPHRVSKRII